MKNGNEITVVAVMRDRPLDMLGNFLHTLGRQTRVPGVLLVDYGSTPENVKALQVLRKETMSFDLVPVQRNTGVWCKSRALNIGLRQVTTPFVLFTDVDLMLERNLVQEVLRLLLKKDRVFVTARTFRMPPAFAGEYRKKWERGSLHGKDDGPSGTGGCQAARVSLFKGLRGYDEQFILWGSEDEDMVQRMALSGVDVVRLPSQVTRLWHQWHPHQRSANPNAYHRQWLRNKTYMRALARPGLATRNMMGWGEL